MSFMKMSFRSIVKQSRPRASGLTATLLLLASLVQSFAVPGISDNALQQISALEAEKAARTLAQQKMDSQLIYALKQSRNEPFASGVINLQFLPVPDANGRLRIDITATVTADLLAF